MEEKDMIYASLPAVLLPWYAQNARDLPWRADREPYHIWISEIMLQQTRVEAVREYYIRFLHALPSIEDLAFVEENRLLKLWEGLGYYTRARNLQKAAREIVHQWGGVFPQEYAHIRALPGIGPYTAGAIASICFEQPVPAVDGNVLRVAARLTDDHTPVQLPQMKADISQRLAQVYPAQSCGAFTQALMELGATVCTPKSPKCGDCPARAICLARQNGTAAGLPVRLPKREKREEDITVLLLQCGDAYALGRRKEDGLLAGMWELPNVPGILTAQQAAAAAEDMGAQPERILSETHRTHVFTHVRWEMTCFHMLCAGKCERWIWAELPHIQREFSIPTAFRMFLDIL